MKIFIVEDEELAVKKLQKTLHAIDANLEVTGTADSIAAAVEWLQTNERPDLILMDIELADGQSFEIFNLIEVKSPVIFTTSYDEYALKAFKVNSIDYLLKPVKQEELTASIEKLRQIKQQYSSEMPALNIQSLLKEFQKQNSYRERFLIKQADRLIPIETGDIAFFCTQEKINFIHTYDSKVYPADLTLDEIEKTLDPKMFFRANRQYIVNAAAVEKIHFWFSSKLKVDLKPKAPEEVIVSREKAMAFRNWLGE